MKPLAILPVLLCVAMLDAQQPASGPIIQTYAGGDFAFQSEGQPAVNAPFGLPSDVATDAAGNIYLADVFYRAFRIQPNGTVNALAGNGFRGPTINGFDARKAAFYEVRSITPGPDGNIYIGGGGYIAKVTPAGTATLIAGGGNGFSSGGGGAYGGDGGPALQASIGDYILCLTFDRAGNLIFADGRNNRVRKIDTNGIITTVAGNGGAASDGDGGPATSARINFPRGVALDAAGNLYISDSGGRIRRVDTAGIITTFASGLATPSGLGFDEAGNLYVAEFGRHRITKLSPDGRTATTFAGTGVAGFSGDGGPAVRAQFNEPIGLRVDAAGNVLVTDSINGRIRKIAASDGTISTIAGNGQFRFSPDGTPATLSYFQETWGLAVSPAGLVHVSDRFAATVYRIEADGTRTRVAGLGTKLPGTDAPGPARSIGLQFPQLLAFDRPGNLYIADQGRVRRVTPAGLMSTVAGGGAANPAAGGLATSANLNPQGVLLDDGGNLYISELTRITRVTPDGRIGLFAGTGISGFKEGDAAQAQFVGATAMVLDSQGNLYVSDQGNARVRKITPGGIVSTFAGGGTANPAAGGPALGAQLINNYGIRFDANGGLLIASPGWGKLLRVAPDGRIGVIAGDGRSRFAGDGGPAILASLYFPYDVAVDEAGNIFVSDQGNARIRVIPAAAPTLTASPTSLTFTVRAGEAAPAPKPVTLSSSTLGLPFTVTTSAGFLAVSVSASATPSRASVTVNPGALGPGTYSGTVTFTPNVAGVAPAIVTVSLTIEPAQPSQLTVSTAGLQFSFVRQGAAETRNIVVSDRGGGGINFTAVARTTGGGDWLSVTPASGKATAAAPVPLVVTANPGTLSPNSYTGSITVADASGAGTIVVPVTMTVSNSAQSIRLSNSGLTFLAVAGAGVSPQQSVTVLNTGQGAYSFTVRTILPSGAPNWLSVVPSSPTVDSSQLAPVITVSANPTGLAAGDYYGRVEVISATADNSPQMLTVVLRVLPASADPGPQVQPSALIFTGVAGGPDPPSQSVTVTNLAGAPLTFGSSVATLDGGRYVDYLPTGGTVTPGFSLTVKPTFAGLAPGVYRGAVVLVFSQGAIQTVGILIVIAPAGTVITGGRPATTGCTPRQLLPQISSLGSNFTVPASFPTVVDVHVVDDCGAPSEGGTVVASFSNGDPPLSLTSVGGGRWSGTWVNRNTSLNSVSVTATAENPALQLRGSIQINGGLSGDAKPPLIGAGGIVSASSFAAQAPLAPGAMISIYGSRMANGFLAATSLPLSSLLAGTTVLVGGVNVPLLFSSEGQVNALLPLNLPVNTRTQMLVTRGDEYSVPEEILIAPAQPGIFSANSSGKGQGHIYVAQSSGTLLLADSRNPAKAGDTLVIYCSGLGGVDSPVTDGGAAPSNRLVRTANPVTATIAGAAARVDFAGLAPGFAVGLYQVNLTVPQGVPSGDSPLVLTIAGQSSPVVTLAVR